MFYCIVVCVHAHKGLRYIASTMICTRGIQSKVERCAQSQPEDSISIHAVMEEAVVVTAMCCHVCQTLFGVQKLLWTVQRKSQYASPLPHGCR